MCISYHREVLKLRCVSHQDRPATLLPLAQVLIYHYGKHGYEDSIRHEVMKLASEVQAIYSLDSHECRAAGLALQTYALNRATISGSLGDIDKLTVCPDLPMLPGVW